MDQVSFQSKLIIEIKGSSKFSNINRTTKAIMQANGYYANIEILHRIWAFGRDLVLPMMDFTHNSCKKTEANIIVYKSIDIKKQNQDRNVTNGTNYLPHSIL